MSGPKPKPVSNALMSIYISPSNKRKMNIISKMLNKPVSHIVEQLCINFISKWPEVDNLPNEER